METSQELQHWGIKGQKWGIRRYQNPDGSLTEAGKKRYYYQNPDGSLTEAGKKDYMKAAKKGKLDVSKLSDNDLNMINSRFAREKTFKQNVSDYEKSTFKYRLKEAALARIKGSGGGGGGGKGKGGGSGIAKMLAMPIKKAFTDAFTESKGGKGKNEGGDDEDEERREVRDYRRWKKHGRRFTDHYVSDLKDEQVSKALRDKDVDRGRLYLGHKKGKMGVDDSVGRLGFTDSTRNGTDYMQRRLEERRAARESAKDPALKAQRREENRQRQEAAARRRERELEERAKKSGIIIGHSAFVVRRDSSDELYHYGIKGQKWGVRRFENLDGTLTPEGKEQYSKSDDKHPDLDYRNSEAVGEYVFNLHQKYHDAARNDAVWRKHGLGQDTVGRFVEQKKYGDMVNHIDSVVKESREAAIKASDAARKSRENARKPGPLWENMNRKNVEYWDKFQETADEYIKNNFSNADQEVARGVIYWWYIDW